MISAYHVVSLKQSFGNTYSCFNSLVLHILTEEGHNLCSNSKSSTITI